MSAWIRMLSSITNNKNRTCDHFIAVCIDSTGLTRSCRWTNATKRNNNYDATGRAIRNTQCDDGQRPIRQSTDLKAAAARIETTTLAMEDPALLGAVIPGS